VIELRGYIDKQGKQCFAEWFENLDAPAAAKVTIALTRMEQGNFSNVKSVGSGVFEYKIDFGPGYRIYFGKDGDRIVPIAAGPATGHDWILELPAGVEQIEDGPARPVDPSKRLGSAVGGYLRVTAPQGTYVITARLARPWERDRPVRVVEIQLRVE
jgi:putative addiction module killer protein